MKDLNTLQLPVCTGFCCILLIVVITSTTTPIIIITIFIVIIKLIVPELTQEGVCLCACVCMCMCTVSALDTTQGGHCCDNKSLQRTLFLKGKPQRLMGTIFLDVLKKTLSEKLKT